MLQYLFGTLDLVLELLAIATSVIKWWIDAAYSVHDNMGSHVGTTMSMGRESIYIRLSKQKLNTKSSTEAEFIGASDGASHILRTKYFYASKDSRLKKNKLYQENQSAELLEKNGRMPSRQRTGYIHSRYFFYKARIDENEISIARCPTEHMVAY